MKIKLSDHFTYKRLLRFTIPSILTMIAVSVYGIIDGIFVSNFAGKEAFTALNFIYPAIMLFSSFGFLLGTGGSALISKVFGEGDKERANRLFSMVIYTSIILGVLLTVIGLFTIDDIASLLGAEGELLDNCVIYAIPLMISVPFFMLQLEFQTFFNTAEKPKMGLFCTICAGVLNIILDALLVGVFKFGLIGASIASMISQMAGGLFPVIYFIRKNSSILKIGKPIFDIKALLKIFTNGSSELISSIAMSVVGLLFNVQLLKYAGEDGVAAYGVLMYVSFFFNSIFIGFSVSTAPIISYHYGANNTKELKSLLRKCTQLVLICSIAMFVLSELFRGVFSGIFTGYDKNLYDLTMRAFFIFAFAFLFMGFAIFFSSFFTALNDGLSSAVISIFRTLIFQVATVLILPLIFNIDGIWASVVVSEGLTVIVAIIFLLCKRKKYKY